jgi:hypothetical protein
MAGMLEMSIEWPFWYLLGMRKSWIPWLCQALWCRNSWTIILPPASADSPQKFRLTHLHVANRVETCWEQPHSSMQN